MRTVRNVRVVVASLALLAAACGGSGGAGGGGGFPALDGGRPATAEELTGSWALYDFLIEDLTTGQVLTPATVDLWARLDLFGDGTYSFEVCGPNGCDEISGTWAVDATQFWDTGVPAQYSYDGDRFVLEDLGTLPQDRHLYHAVLWFRRDGGDFLTAKPEGAGEARSGGTGIVPALPRVLFR